MTPLIIPFSGNEPMAAALAPLISADIGGIAVRQFPDMETYLRILDAAAGRDVVLLCTLDHPNEKLLPLLFAAATLRELGAARIGLVAPYLAYMRQDTRFHPGEAVSSRHVAELLSSRFDWLVTADPHLHRYRSLSDIYTIPYRVAHAAPLIAQWIRNNVSDAVIVGPDSESKQWVSEVARDAQVPFTVLDKQRHGDRDVSITVRDIDALSHRTPILVDDIIASGTTMLEAVRGLIARTVKAPVCIGIHGIFADNSDKALQEAGARVITCNSIRHPTNAIDITALLAVAATALIHKN